MIKEKSKSNRLAQLIPQLSTESLLPIKRLSKTKSISKVTSKDIAWLWLNMTKAFGYKFTQNFGEKDDGIWLEGLKDLTREDLDFGFKHMLTTISEDERSKGEAWPPNVKEFRMHCEHRLQAFKLPKIHDAFSEAKTNSYLAKPRWSHPLIKLSAKMLNKPNSEYIHDEDYTKFAAIYSNLSQRYMQGEALTLIP